MSDYLTNKPPISFINKFPFTKEAKDYVKIMEITPDILMDDHSLVNKAINSINKLIEKNYVVLEILYLNTEDNWKHYALIGYFLNLIGESILWSRFAEVMRNEIEKNISAEKSSGDLLRIAKNTFSWELIRIEDKTILNMIYNWKLKWTDFISVSSYIMDENWKLINNHIEKGWIYLKGSQVKRLLAERVRSEINKKSKIHSLKIPLEIEEPINKIKNAIKNIKKKYQESSYNITSEERIEAYPPCINSIINKAKSGMNLTHFERLILVFFLLNVDFSVDDVINIFKLQPDFAEDKAKYYIEHAAGKVGGRTKYKPYNCIKLQSFEGICKKNQDPRKWCISNEKNKQIKNPLVYYKRMAWVISKSVKCPNCGQRFFKDIKTKKYPDKCFRCNADLSDVIQRKLEDKKE